MKIVTILLSVLMITFTALAEINDETNSDEYVPEPFDQMATNIDTYADLIPVAIYRVRNFEKNFVCVGTLFKTNFTAYTVLIPKHLLTEDVALKGKYTFGVQLMRPASSEIICYITGVHSIMTTKENFDVALGDLGTNQVEAAGMIAKFSKETPPIVSKRVQFSPAKTVTIDGKETKFLRSLITGKQVNILGYGMISNAPPNIVIEMKAGSGYSGSAFFDENKRLFILGGETLDNGYFLKSAGEGYFQREYGHEVKSIALLVGPIDLERCTN